MEIRELQQSSLLRKTTSRGVTVIGGNEKENRRADLLEKNFSPVKKKVHPLVQIRRRREEERVVCDTRTWTLDRECSAGCSSNRGGRLERQVRREALEPAPEAGTGIATARRQDEGHPCVVGERRCLRTLEVSLEWWKIASVESLPANNATSHR